MVFQRAAISPEASSTYLPGTHFARLAGKLRPSEYDRRGGAIIPPWRTTWERQLSIIKETELSGRTAPLFVRHSFSEFGCHRGAV